MISIIMIVLSLIINAKAPDYSYILNSKEKVEVLIFRFAPYIRAIDSDLQKQFIESLTKSAIEDRKERKRCQKLNIEFQEPNYQEQMYELVASLIDEPIELIRILGNAALQMEAADLIKDESKSEEANRQAWQLYEQHDRLLAEYKASKTAASSA